MLDQKWVLTAAKCVANFASKKGSACVNLNSWEGLTVILGESDLTKDERHEIKRSKYLFLFVFINVTVCTVFLRIVHRQLVFPEGSGRNAILKNRSPLACRMGGEERSCR